MVSVDMKESGAQSPDFNLHHASFPYDDGTFSITLLRTSTYKFVQVSLLHDDNLYQLYQYVKWILFFVDMHKAKDISGPHHHARSGGCNSFNNSIQRIKACESYSCIPARSGDKRLIG